MQTNVLTYLDDIVKKVPDKVAFADGDESYTFEKVYRESRAVGTALAKAGLSREPVAVFTEKHPKTVVAFLGVITAGCFYVPIDSDMPQTRVNLILGNCRARAIICDRATEQKAYSLGFGGKIMMYDTVAAAVEDGEILAGIRDRALDIDPVYIVFTSGSTGVPKGVTACHRSVIDYIEQLSDVLEFDENTVFANQAPLYFDSCLKEIFPTLKFGATTYFVPRSLFMFPVKLIEYLNEHRINTICWVVSALTMISSLGAFNILKPKYLKTVAFGGEVFPSKQFKIWRDALPNATFTNLYGPTEGTGMCCYYRVGRELSDGEAVPVGRPFGNTEILLVNERGEAAEEGEIYIRGAGVTLGYYNDPERTAAAYVQNPLNKAYPETVYRTGDLGRYNEYGELVFVSRRDSQIKHMGHRIELGEIEANAAAADGVALCACVYNGDSDKITLYYSGSAPPAEVKTFLRGRLPRYMLPGAVKKLAVMPLTANGKIDRALLKRKCGDEENG